MGEPTFVEVQWARDVTWAWGMVAGLVIIFLLIGKLHRVGWLIGSVTIGCMVWFLMVGRLSVAVTPRDIQTAIGLFAHGKVELSPWVRPFPLTEGARVFRELLSQPSDYVKGVLLP